MPRCVSCLHAVGRSQRRPLVGIVRIELGRSSKVRARFPQELTWILAQSGLAVGPEPLDTTEPQVGQCSIAVGSDRLAAVIEGNVTESAEVILRSVVAMAKASEKSLQRPS